MGGKQSKREGLYGSTPPRGSPSSKVSRSRSLPTKVFTRRLSYDLGGSFRGRPLHEESEDSNHLEEYQRLIELEKANGKENTGFCGGTSHDIIRNCISPNRGSKEEIIYEEGDYDNIANESGEVTEAENLKDSPVSSRGVGRSRLSSCSSAPCLVELVGKGEASDGEDLIEVDTLVKSSSSNSASPVAENLGEVVIELSKDIDPPLIKDHYYGENLDLNGSVLQCSSTHADNFLEVEEEESTRSNLVSLPPGHDSVGEIRDVHVYANQQESLLKFASSPDRERSQGQGTGTYSEIPEGCSGEASLRSEREGLTVFKFQSQKISERPRLWRRRRKPYCEQEQLKTADCYPESEDTGNMSGKGKLTLSFKNSGKRLKDSRKNSFNGRSDVVWGTSPGKRIKDGDGGEDSAPSDIHPDAFTWGLMGQSDPFMGFDAAGFMSQISNGEDQSKGSFIRRTRTPSKYSKGRALARKVRGLRASPKPVSSLESCLRAQLVDGSDRERTRWVSRPLDFSSAANGRGKIEDLNMIGYIDGVPSSPDNSPIHPNLVKIDESSAKRGYSGLPGLPNLGKLLKDYAAKLAVGKSGRNSGEDTVCVITEMDDQLLGSPGNGRWKTTQSPVILKKRKISDLKQVLSLGCGHGVNRIELEGSTVVSMEALLFSSGVAAGVRFMADKHRTAAARSSKSLNEAQIQIENLRLEVGRREGPANLYSAETGDGKDTTTDFKGPEKVSAGGSMDAPDEISSVEVESVRSLLTFPGSQSQQEDQMAELEAELEAELDQLTGGDSVTLNSQYAVLDELDMDGVVSIVHGDLTVAGLPARIEEDSDDNDHSAPAQPANMNNYAVSPRELTRLLRKLQATRQEDLLTELEEELQAVQSQLQSKEKELELWKERVRHLNDVSFASASGDEALAPRAPTGAMVPSERPLTLSDLNVESRVAARSSEPLEGQESFHFPLQGAGTWANCSLSDTDHAGARLSDSPKLLEQGEEEMNNTSCVESAKQLPRHTVTERPHSANISAGDDVCNEFLQSMIDGEGEVPSHTEVITSDSKDCRQVMDNAQIEKQLIDVVQGLDTPDYPESSDMGSATPSVCDYSSAASIADAWDQSSETATLLTNKGPTGGYFQRVKLLVPHPSRRSSWNSEAGNPLLFRKQDDEVPLSPQEDHCTAVVKYTEPLHSSNSESEISDTETADYKTSDASYSLKYVEETSRPPLHYAVPLAERKNPLYWEGAGRAGSNTPVEKVRQQLFKTPKDVPHQQPVYLERRPGELSPTVLDKIARWEGLMDGETPGPATGYDWECQSRASECEQLCNLDLVYDDVNVFGEDNLVLEAEEMLGRMLINRIVEKTRRGSGIVKEAQTALATFEGDDGIAGGDGHMMKVTEMNGRADSDASTLSERDYDSREGWSDDQEKTSKSFLAEAVREEYEFFRRLELISKDRKAAKGVQEKPSKETIYLGRLDIESIPELDLGANSQFSQDSEPSRSKEIFSAVGRDRMEESPKETRGKQLADTMSRGRDNWLVCGDARQETYGGSGYREDEVRSRRRL